MNVLSKTIDKAAVEKRISYHPKCKNIRLTHLCFADDLMIFVDGHRKSVEGVLTIFDEFTALSGLKISVEKSTIFMAGVTTSKATKILQHFPLAHGHLPVRYLGLPLATKQLKKPEYSWLIEKVRKRLSTWTARHLSYAGRLQLLASVIAGITNFWLSAYRLPSGCIKELDHVCSAFLWSGPDLNSRKAKIRWEEVCCPKREGGLGLQSLRIANTVSCLKLIWRILSRGDSLWVKWTTCYHLRQHTFWEIRENTVKGSWMWRKLLKLRGLAKSFYKVDVRNGRTTSFWFDTWNEMGCIYDITGPRGFIDMGIPAHATVEFAKTNPRRRRHRSEIYILIESAIASTTITCENDIPLWKSHKDKFKTLFNTKTTKDLVCPPTPTSCWYKGVWFRYATPKYSFITWLAIHNRLSTGDKMSVWHPEHRVVCVFCGCTHESRNHLFFTCRFSEEVWYSLVGRLLGNDYTPQWNNLIDMLNSPSLDRTHFFIFRYAFQATIYHIWRERNCRRHGDQGASAAALIRMIDKNVRNRFSSIRNQADLSFADGLSTWFASR